jgi:hypothetical protein
MLEPSPSPSASLLVREFALNGLAGARTDEIAARTRSSKRIYYCFGDKDGLCLSALEKRLPHGSRMREQARRRWAIAARSAPTSRRVHVRSSQWARAYIRMVMIENIHHGEFLERSKAIRGLNVTALIRSRRFTPVVSPMGLFGRVSIPRTSLADQRARFLQRLEPGDVQQDFRLRCRLGESPKISASSGRRDGALVCRSARQTCCKVGGKLLDPSFNPGDCVRVTLGGNCRE